MGYKIYFENFTIEDLFSFLKNNKNRKVLNFLNQHDLFQFKSEKKFRDTVISKTCLNFIDGSTISRYLSIKKLKRVRRMRGPSFTRLFLSNKDLSGDLKHFFIGFKNKDIKDIKKALPHIREARGYNPPYVKGIEFSSSEVNKMIKNINDYNPDIVWIGIGCPKQNILSQQLFEKTKAKYFMNIGAALDFILGKKEEAPKMIQALGIEWLYRLVTDFKYTRKKVWRSFVGLKYLKYADLRKR